MALEREHAMIVANAARATIRAMGMQAENQQRESNDEAPAYVEKDFVALIVDECIDWNYVIEQINRGG